MNAEAYMRAVRQLPLIAPDVLIGAAPVVVVSPHPDDEALGAGGLIAAARGAGRRVVVVMLTDGSGSHPNSRRYPRDQLIALRKAEALHSARELGLSEADLIHLDLPDGNAPTEGPLFDRTVNALAAVVSDVAAASVMVSGEHDPHGDHQAAALMGRALRARDPRLKLWFYPIWGWHLEGNTPIEAPPPSGYRIDIRPWLAAKHAAIAAHVSQTTNLIDDDPEGFHLDERTLAPFLGPYEYFLEVPQERELLLGPKGTPDSSEMGSMPMRICFVVLAHHQPHVFGRLIRRISSSQSDVVVHIDERSDIKEFSTIDLPNVHYVSDRRKVHWAGWSQTQAVLKMLEYGLQVSTANYFIFLAGTDFPIKSNEDLLKYLHRQYPRNFMNWYPLVPGGWGYQLIGRYHVSSVVVPLMDIINVKNTAMPTASRTIDPYVTKASEELNAQLGPRDTTWKRFYHGSSRWCLNRDSVRYLVDYYNSSESQPLKDYLILSTNSDEIFIQTVILNSPHREQCVGFDDQAASEIFDGKRPPMPDETRVYLHYIDWSPEREDPAILVESDFEKLKNCDKYFACKFLDEKSRGLLRLIESELDNGQYSQRGGTQHAAPLGSFAGNRIHTQAYWENFYGREDPWNYGNSYEQSKYRQTLDSLPEGPIDNALELACAEGHFTVQLATKVKRLTAADISATALARARRRCAGFDEYRFSYFGPAGGRHSDRIRSRGMQRSAVLYREGILGRGRCQDCCGSQDRRSFAHGARV